MRRALLAAGALSILTACGGEGGPGVAESRLEVAPVVVRLLAGDSAIVSTSVAGALIPPRGLVWSSSDSGVIAVASASGNAAWLRARDAGAAIVGVELAGRPETRVSIPVTALAPCELAVPLTGYPPSVQVRLGVPTRPDVFVAGCHPGADSALVYASSDTSVVAIDAATGLPLGRRPGQATVTVRLRAAPSRRIAVSASVMLPMCPLFPSLVVQPSSLTLAPSDTARVAVTVTFAPGPPGPYPVPRFTSSDSAVATVSADGLIRARSPGDAVVRVSLDRSAELGCSGPYHQDVSVRVRAP